MDEMEKQIEETLTAAVDDIFLTYQAKLHVISGDITPMDSVALESRIAELAVLIKSILDYERKLSITNIWKDGQVYDAQELANDYETFDLLRQLQEKIEEKHNGK